ncbi:MAG TPA: hypothetical protein VFQ05_15980, partial [Candidatus Eisenbacteria bacterium]|nr:hypothetical protein [Candidatus Eisenbacteria bacterium]
VHSRAHMVDWLMNMHWIPLMILIVGAFAVFGFLGFGLTRRYVMPGLGASRHQAEVTATIVHGILIIYGLAVALLAIAVWEKYAEATRIVAEEASSIAALYRDLAGYPEPLRTHLRNELKSYTEYTIRDAWPMQRRGQIPAAGVGMLDRFQDALYAYEPATLGKLAHHQEALGAYNTMIQIRRERLHFVTIGLPASMWAVVLVGALITVASAFFLDVGEGGKLNRLLMVLLSAIMGLLIFMIVYYDQPMRGDQSVSPEAYEVIHKQLMEH